MCNHLPERFLHHENSFFLLLCKIKLEEIKKKRFWIENLLHDFEWFDCSCNLVILKMCLEINNSELLIREKIEGFRDLK